MNCTKRGLRCRIGVVARRRNRGSTDATRSAALAFALKLVNERGNVSEADVQAVRKAGFSDEQVVEVLAHVALNLFTNYVNVAFAVPVDFAPVKLSRAAA